MPATAATGFGYTHYFIRHLASWALYSFFQRVEVVNGDNVPREGGVIVASSHHNMAVDPATLSCTFPGARCVHYWAKDSLFKVPAVRAILLDAGNIPVDRKNKDNQALFKGTFHALARGEVVAIFPEGTSYTSPSILGIKDGVSWAALEYTKYVVDNHIEHGKDVPVVPCGITYTNKSKYRSRAVVEYGKPIYMTEFEKEFLSVDPKAAVKKLSARIESELRKLTINAPDWDTFYAAKMAREMLWEDERDLPLEDFVPVSQVLVDLLSTPSPSPQLSKLKSTLITYSALLSRTSLTHSTLSSLPLPRPLDPYHPYPLPTRLSTLLSLIGTSLASLVRLPFFALPLLVHAPAYILARLGGKMVEHEEETQAQNKIVFGLLLTVLTYPVLFLAVWALLFLSPIGAIVAAAAVWAFAVYHVSLIDDNYNGFKRVMAAWRVLVGVWLPKKWDYDLAAVSQYLKAPTHSTASYNFLPNRPSPLTSTSSAPAPAPTPPSEPSSTPKDKKKDKKKDKRDKKEKKPSGRRLIRQLLRTRLDAVRALSTLLLALDSPQEAHEHELVPKDALLGREKNIRPSEVTAWLRERGAAIEPREADHGLAVGSEDSDGFKSE